MTDNQPAYQLAMLFQTVGCNEVSESADGYGPALARKYSQHCPICFAVIQNKAGSWTQKYANKCDN